MRYPRGGNTQHISRTSSSRCLPCHCYDDLGHRHQSKCDLIDIQYMGLFSRCLSIVYYFQLYANGVNGVLDEAGVVIGGR